MCKEGSDENKLSVQYQTFPSGYIHMYMHLRRSSNLTFFRQHTTQLHFGSPRRRGVASGVVPRNGILVELYHTTTGRAMSGEAGTDSKFPRRRAAV